MSKTAAEIEQELTAKNSEARALRRALRAIQKAELMSAEIALGETFSRVFFADTPQAMYALIRTLNEGDIVEEVRCVFGGSTIGDTSTEEPQDEPQWGSDAGDDPTRTMNTRVFGWASIRPLEWTERARSVPGVPLSESTMTFEC